MAPRDGSELGGKAVPAHHCLVQDELARKPLCLAIARTMFSVNSTVRISTLLTLMRHCHVNFGRTA